MKHSTEYLSYSTVAKAFLHASHGGLNGRDSPRLFIPFIDCSLWKNECIPTSQNQPEVKFHFLQGGMLGKKLIGSALRDMRYFISMENSVLGYTTNMERTRVPRQESLTWVPGYQGLRTQTHSTLPSFLAWYTALHRFNSS